MNDLNALESAYILGIANEATIFPRKPNVKNIEKWDRDPKYCVLLAFVKVNSKLLNNMCSDKNRSVVDIDINEINPVKDHLDEKIMGVRQSQYRNIYNALAKIPVINTLLHSDHTKELDKLKETYQSLMASGPERSKLIKDVMAVLSPLGDRYRFVLKGLSEEDKKNISGLESMPYVIKK